MKLSKLSPRKCVSTAALASHDCMLYQALALSDIAVTLAKMKVLRADLLPGLFRCLDAVPLRLALWRRPRGRGPGEHGGLPTRLGLPLGGFSPSCFNLVLPFLLFGLLSLE